MMFIALGKKTSSTVRSDQVNCPKFIHLIIFKCLAVEDTKAENGQMILRLPGRYEKLQSCNYSHHNQEHFV